MNIQRTKLIISALLVLSFCLLLLSQLRGLYSWDYFTLWGTHPKYIWATGDFFASGVDLPHKFKYQSIWGTFVGVLAYVVNPKVYFDSLWACFNIILIAGLCGLITFIDNERWKKISFIAFIFGFIPSTVMGQLTWGGYVDLTAVLFICLGLKFFEQNRIKLASLSFAGCILTKMTLWPWIIILGGAITISDFSFRKIKDFFLIYFLPVVISLVLLNLLYPQESSSRNLSFYQLAFKLKSFSYLFNLYLQSFFSLNAIMLLVFTWGVVKRDKFVVSYVVCGMAYISLIYIFFLDATASEAYPSFKRYLMPIFLPLAFYIFDKIKWSKPLVLTTLALLLSMVRFAEDYSKIKNVKIVWFKDFCTHSPIACESRDRLISQFPNQKRIDIDQNNLGQYKLSKEISLNEIFYVALPNHFIYY